MRRASSTCWARMIEVTAAIGRAGSSPQRSSQWRRASAIGSMLSGGDMRQARLVARARRYSRAILPSSARAMTRRWISDVPS